MRKAQTGTVISFTNGHSRAELGAFVTFWRGTKSCIAFGGQTLQGQMVPADPADHGRSSDTGVSSSSTAQHYWHLQRQIDLAQMYCAGASARISTAILFTIEGIQTVGFDNGEIGVVVSVKCDGFFIHPYL